MHLGESNLKPLFCLFSVKTKQRRNDGNIIVYDFQNQQIGAHGKRCLIFRIVLRFNDDFGLIDEHVRVESLDSRGQIRFGTEKHAKART